MQNQLNSKATLIEEEKNCYHEKLLKIYRHPRSENSLQQENLLISRSLNFFFFQLISHCYIYENNQHLLTEPRQSRDHCHIKMFRFPWKLVNILLRLGKFF